MLFLLRRLRPLWALLVTTTTRGNTGTGTDLMTTESTMASVIEGPDLNPSRTPLDRKVYRQILLPNGLKAVLISDTVAMQQALYFDDDELDEEEQGEDGEAEEDMGRHGEEGKDEGDDADDDDDDADGDEDDGEDEDDYEEDNENDDDDKKDVGDDGLRDAAAAMVVGVGSMYDPPEAQGLAHFLEHMLFMGSEKYPQENAYSQYISKHGGDENAYTDMENTVYHLSLPQENLFPALDMLAQFFIKPLMLEDAVERELLAVESEFKLTLKSDQSRLEQLLAHTSSLAGSGTSHKPHHPFATFSWGNLLSLKEWPASAGVNVMKLLREFYDRYYFASNMRLVVIGAYSLDDLQKHVLKSFSDIPSNPRLASPENTIKYSRNGDDDWSSVVDSPMKKYGLPLPASSLGKVYRMVPVRDRHTLSLTWQIPPQFSHWKSKPYDYLSHLLGHEAQGSILASLKKKSWATECFVGVGSDGLEFASSHALFVATFSLSEEGVRHWKEIVAEVFRYIGMLRYHCKVKGGLPQWIHEELKSTLDIAYRFSDEESAESLVETLADRLAPHFQIPPARLLDAQELLWDFDADRVEDLLDNYLTPGNARFDIMSSTFGRAAGFEEAGSTDSQCESSKDDNVCALEGEQFEVETAGPPMVEPMFGTRYWCRRIPNSVIAQWEEAARPQLPDAPSTLRLPPKNPFLPQNLDLKPLPPEDSHHPLLNASVKISVTVGKQKSWFPATITKYNSLKNSALLYYEDECEKWHKLDAQASDLTTINLVPGFEGTLDNKAVKFRLVALARDGEGAVMKFGDECDDRVEEGISFPAIPPAASASRLPKLFYDSQKLKLWHLQDRKFKRPIAELRLRLISPAANKSPLHRACSDLLVKLCTDATTETNYLASVAELDSTLMTSDNGLTIRVHGFDCKLLELFHSIFEVILSFRGRKVGLPDRIVEGRFEACLEVLKRNYANDGISASKLSSDVRIRCLMPTTHSADSRSRAIQDISVALFCETIAEILDNFALQVLFHGNVNEGDVESAKSMILELVEACGGLPKKKHPLMLVSKIPLSTEGSQISVPTRDPTDPNTSVEVYFQVGKDNIRDRVMTDLIAQMMYEPLFDQVRTRDTFGYSVSCDSRWSEGVMGIYFKVVSSSKTASDITDRVEKFIVEFKEVLTKMAEKEFLEHLAGVAKNKLDMFNSLSEECDCYWGEIRDNRLDWEVNRNEALALRSITKEDVLKCYYEWLSPVNREGRPNKRRMLVVQVLGGQTRPDVQENMVGSTIEEKVADFHKGIGSSNWGKIL